MGVRYPRAVGSIVRAWGPSTVPLACMPCGGLPAAGVVAGRPGGDGLPPWWGASGVRLEKESDQHLNPYRPEGANIGKHGRGYQGSRPGQGTTPKNARYMSRVQDLFQCDARDQQGEFVHAPDCDQHQCFVIEGKKQESKSGGKC